MVANCNSCRFSHSLTHEAGFDTFCRFDTPEFVPPNGSVLLPVRADGWCGKWQNRASATEKVLAPGSDPNTVRSRKPSVRTFGKKGVAAII